MSIPRIKEAINLRDLVNEYVPLKKKGTRWMAPCPFHGPERTASFGVRNESYWHCFGCGTGGDCFDFIARIEGISKSAAIRQLSARTGIPLDGKPVSRIARAYNAQEEAFAVWWQKRQVERLSLSVSFAVTRGLSGYECEQRGRLLRQVRALKGVERRALADRAATKEDRADYEWDRWFADFWLSLATLEAV